MESFLNGRVTLHKGDCLDVLRSLPDACVDSVVTDPPYALVSIAKRFGKEGAAPAKGDVYARASAGFMGKQWDTGETAFAVEFWLEVLRVLKPGGHVLAFGGTRTYHRLVCAIEDAGFEIRDQVGWLYGSGFPKSLDVSKAIDKAAGVRGHDSTRFNAVGQQGERTTGGDKFRSDHPDYVKPQGITDAARKWQGWGTALKPAWEPICVARKPLEGTVAANVQKHGTGAINIDACRVVSSTGQRPGDTAWESDQSLCASCADHAAQSAKHGTLATRASTAIKPAGLPLSERAEPSQPDTLKTDIGCSGGMRADATAINSSIGAFGRMPTDPSQEDVRSTTSTRTEAITGSTTCNSCGRPITGRSTSGNTTAAKRSLPPAGNSNAPVAPAGRWPSNLIHDGSEEVEQAFAAFGTLRARGNVTAHGGSGRSNGLVRNAPQGGIEPGWAGDTGTASRFFYTAKADAEDRAGSKHPTVKPVDLMRYLVRLVTPPGGTVLDPFAGTGTTGQAAYLEGCSAVLVEREAEYQSDIARRMALVLAGPDERARERVKAKGKVEMDAGPLFGGWPEAAE